MNDKMVIFGSGKLGRKALAFFGDENVWCFCDNNPNLAGTEKYGKEIISFEELKQKYSDAIIVIAVGDLDSYAIAKQCEENGVSDYVSYIFMREMFPDWEKTQMLVYIADLNNRAFMRRDLYFREVKQLETQIRDLQKQVDYFKDHVDIRLMKPAKGRLRSRQLEWVREAAKFFDKISELGVRPILYGGNLLGHIRHNGFIPWDDDMDFALIREEYEKLKAYCRLHIRESKIGEKDPMKEGKEIPAGMEDYVFGERFHFFFINKMFPDGHYAGMDFFALDYYAEGYEFTELKEYTESYIERLEEIDSPEEKLEYVRAALAENKQNAVKDSSQIYWGIDNMEILHRYYPKEQFMPKEVVFPLKKILFEGEYFWAPNDIEEFLKYEFGDFMEFPDDIGLQRHCEASDEAGE